MASDLLNFATLGQVITGNPRVKAIDKNTGLSYTIREVQLETDTQISWLVLEEED